MKKTTKKKAAKKTVKKDKAKKIVKKTVKKKPARKANAAFMKNLTPSSALAEVTGSQPMPRTEIIKKIWDYIKLHGLQDQTNKRMINADAKLLVLFEGKNQISMFDLAKIVSKNVK